MARRTFLLLRGTRLTIAGIAPLAASHVFDDVPDHHIFHDDIAWIYSAGITTGCNPGQGGNNYCPYKNVTRGQMAAFLRRALETPPGKVTGLIATLAGGSGEIDVSWSPNSEPDLDHYNVWHSELPGDPKTLITNPYSGPDTKPNGRVYIIDWPRALISGQDCYQVSAVDTTGQEGPRSDESCFDSTPGPPSQVTGVVAMTAGGSGEIAVYWNEVPELDVNDYNVWYSEFPGGTKTLLDSPYFGPAPTTGNRWYIIDWPRSLIVGRDCYQISAVDLSGNEGLRSAEACFAP